MISERDPAVAEHVEHAMTHTKCTVKGVWPSIHDASGRLDWEGFWWRPTWSELRHGKRPPDSVSSEPSEWQHGWQFWASSVSDTHFRKNSVLSRCTAARQAHLRSHSGHNAGVLLACAPTTPECTVPPLLFHVLLLERLQLPLPIVEVTCEGCGDPVDSLGRHRAARPRTGRLRKRATPIERMVARIFREAGAQVRYNAYLRDMNVGVSSVDERRVEVLVQDLPCFAGSQLAVDVTLVSALCSTGEPNHTQQKWTVLCWSEHGMSRKQPTQRGPYRRDADWSSSPFETGGRSSEEAVHMIRLLAIARARDVPRYMTRQVSWAWERRWTRMLATNMRCRFRCHPGGAVQVVRHLVPHRRHGTRTRRPGGAGFAVVSLSRFRL